MNNTYEICSATIGTDRGYNVTYERVRVEVTMFDRNVENPRTIERIEGVIAAMYPDTPASPGGYARRGTLDNLGVVRVVQRPSTRRDGVPWDFAVGAWEFTITHYGCD